MKIAPRRVNKQKKSQHEKFFFFLITQVTTKSKSLIKNLFLAEVLVSSRSSSRDRKILLWWNILKVYLTKKIWSDSWKLKTFFNEFEMNQKWNTALRLMRLITLAQGQPTFINRIIIITKSTAYTYTYLLFDKEW